MTRRDQEGPQDIREKNRVSMTREAAAVTVDEVKGLLEHGLPITFIDSRNPIAWGASKVKRPGAIRVPLDQVDRLLPRLPRDRRLIVYCT